MKQQYQSLSVSPFVYITPSLTNMSLMVICVLSPQILMLFLTKSFASLVVLSVCIVSSVCAELLSNTIRKRKSLFDLTAVVQGLCIGFFTPSQYPLIPLFFIVFFALIVIKYTFGGSSHSWANPVAYSVIILYLLGNSIFPSMPLERSMLETGTSVQELIENGSINIYLFDSNLTQWLNTTLFKPIGVEVPQGYLSLMWDSHSVIPAFRFGLLTLCGSLLLFSYGMLRHSIPLVFLLTYGILIRLFALTPLNGIVGQGDIILALFSGGSLFTAFFLLDWYGTTPLSPVGKLIYGIIAGVFAYLIMGTGSSSIGAMFTVLAVNIFSPCIQLTEDKLYEFMIHKNTEKNNDKTGVTDAAVQ